jgi:translation initiation factor IF-2
VRSEDGREDHHIKPPIVVKELASQMGLKPFQVISDLMEMNIFARDQSDDRADVATKVCAKHGFLFEKSGVKKAAACTRWRRKSSLRRRSPRSQKR